MLHAPTLPAPGGATEKHAPRRALFARLAPHASILLAILAITLIWLDAFDDRFLADDRTHLQRIVVAAFLTAILLPLALLIVRYEKGLARARDAAEAAMRARSEFLAVMSHEIRTPLNAVLGFASTLLESKLDTEQRLNAIALHGAGDDLLRLLNGILDFSALDAGRIQFEDVVFAPAAMVEMTASIVKRNATAKGLALRVDVDPDVPSALRGDAGRLRQVLLNLLTNAIKFTQSGEIVVTVRRLAGTSKNATVQWSVTDPGIGIAPDHIDGVFSGFVQADSSVSRRFGGSGLGLAICKRIIDQMEGRIGAESVVGRGSTFTFSVTLPITEPVIEAEASAGGAIADLAAAEAAIIDPTAVDEFIAQVGCDSTDEILTVFLTETGRRLGVLRSLPVDDHAAIRQEAHALKGSSGTFGLTRLSVLSRNLERGASGIAPDDYHAALDGLDDVFARSRHELNIHLRKTCGNRAELAE